MAYDAPSQTALQALIDRARAAGAESSEASISARESLSVEVRLGALEGVEREEARSAALRAFVGKRQAAASTTDLSEKGLAELAERVVAMAKAAPEDAFCGLLDPQYRANGTPPDLEQSDVARPDAGQLQAMALACESASMAIEGVVNSGGGGASWEASAFAHLTSDGFLGSEQATAYGLSAQPIAERDGKMERDYEGRTKRFLADLPGAEEIGRIAGERAVARLGSRKLPSGRAGVLFENRLAARLLGPLLSGMSGASVARGASFVKDKLGQRVLPETFQIFEDPFLKRGLASRAFDGEGGAVKARALIEDGVIATWFLNASTARQLGMAPTGHATHGHGGPPGAATSNLEIKPGAETPGALMKAAGKGVIVTEMFSPALNMNTGDWSVGVSGQWFENGEIAYPVSEITIAGNLLEIYDRLVAASDLERRGAIAIPSLFVDDLAIGGV